MSANITSAPLLNASSHHWILYLCDSCAVQDVEVRPGQGRVEISLSGGGPHATPDVVVWPREPCRMGALLVHWLTD